MPAKKEISLLPSYADQNSVVNKLINWLTSTGRVVIIFTELIVVGSFLSRFWLDRKNSDLSEALRQQKAILSSTLEFEEKYNDFRQRLVAIKTIVSQNPNFEEKINSIIRYTPPEVGYTNIKISSSEDVSVELTAFAIKTDSLVRMISNLKSDKKVKSIKIDRINKNSKMNYYELRMTIKFDKGVTS